MAHTTDGLLEKQDVLQRFGWSDDDLQAAQAFLNFPRHQASRIVIRSVDGRVRVSEPQWQPHEIDDLGAGVPGGGANDSWRSRWGRRGGDCACERM